MHATLDRDYFVASVVISPRSMPEVQALMRLCNEFSMPAWPYSTSVSKSQRRCQRRCQEADNVSSQRAYRVVTVSQL